MIKSFKYRLKSKSLSYLEKAARDVNFVWNYCNDVSIQYLDKRYKWLSGYDLGKLTKGCSEDLYINAQTIQAICQQYAKCRRETKKRKLSWRSQKRSLLWIPFNGQSVRVQNDAILYNGAVSFKVWLSRPIEGKIKSGSFTRNSKGEWFVTFACDVKKPLRTISTKAVGIDLGLKTLAVLSTGLVMTRGNITLKYAQKLATAQRARKKKQVVNIHNKIKNVRKDWNHKQTTTLVNEFGVILVGNVSSSKLKKTRMAKSVSDASWHQFKSMLAYKAVALGVEYKEINEKFSTVTCSNCFERTGPSGLSTLGVREWKCKCGASHNRDVNAAKNILRFGCEALIKGDSL